MVKKITSIDQAPVDVVEAVKRGFIHRGLIPRKYRRNDPLSDGFDPEKAFSPDNSNTSERSKKSASDRKKTSEANNSSGDDSSMVDSEPGSQEAAKDPDEPEPGDTHEKLIDLAEKSHDKLFEADTVFPFTLFPDTVTLDREKLTIANRSFFRVAKIITVPITSLVSAEADVGPFFGSIHMTSKYFLDNTHHLRYMWRHDAEKLHRLLQGYIIAHERGIDVTEVEMEDVMVLLEDLGHSS
jgi:hypothetical protein